MTVTVSITEAEVLDALWQFLSDNLACEVIIGQANRVAEPKGLDFVVMTPFARNRLATNIDTYDQTIPNPTAKTMLQKTEFGFQFDVHGPNSTDNTQIITTLWRDDYGCLALSASGHDIQPLYIDDGKQMPFINGENQYENRWVIIGHLQANPVLSVPQQFANVVNVGLIEVDTTFRG